MKIVLVGEAYGKSEAQFQHPLVGASGRELSLQLGISGLAPYMTMLCRKCKQISRFIEPHCEFCHEHLWPNEFTLMDYWKSLRQNCEVHVTNVFNMRPPSICLDCNSKEIVELGRSYICRDCKSRNVRTNDVSFFFGKEKVTDLPACRIEKNKNGPHLLSEHYHHVRRLWKELTDLKPNLVVALGNTPSWALLNQTGIMSIRGTVHWCERLGLKVIPTIHPAGVMRNWPVRPTVIADLTKAASEKEFPEIRRPERFITIPYPNSDGIEEIKAWFRNGSCRVLRNDIETVRKQISIIGFSRSPSEALVIPFRDCHSEGGKLVDIGKIAADLGFTNNGINFWPTTDLEFTAWKLAIEKLEDPQASLTFQNGIYDMSYYLKMGILPRGADNDTMLWHHSMYPEQPKSLGYLGSVYANDISWKSMRKSSDSLKRDE